MVTVCLYSTERKTDRCEGFIDGDLIESFLDLSPDKMKEVALGLMVRILTVSHWVLILYYSHQFPSMFSLFDCFIVKYFHPPLHYVQHTPMIGKKICVYGSGAFMYLKKEGREGEMIVHSSQMFHVECVCFQDQRWFWDEDWSHCWRPY